MYFAVSTENTSRTARQKHIGVKLAGCFITAAMERSKISPRRVAFSIAAPNRWELRYVRGRSHDGWPDLLVANDTQPNKLYRNQHNGTFKDPQ